MKRRHDGKAVIRTFTLIEMVVVIVILTLLASIATPVYYNYVKKARISAAKAQLKILEQAIFDFRLDTGKLPDDSDGLQCLISNVNNDGKWQGPYLRGKKMPKDPWGNDYIYTCPGENGEFDLISYGADGQAGGEGDSADIKNNEDAQ
ncbi:MAG: type II secretion system major pseudopilin GspG [Victivallales bacterium]|nr:type II secretion system major pseudopilin GspG [Victivallales bacterium]